MDIYDGTAWTEMDIEDLKAAIEHGSGIEEAAELLCRSGSLDDVAQGGGIAAQAEEAPSFPLNLPTTPGQTLTASPKPRPITS